MADSGSAENGAKLFKAKCATCHTCNEGGPNKQGPNLFGVIGRQSGQVQGFKYTAANKGSGITWSNETMFACAARVGSQKPKLLPLRAGLRPRCEHSELESGVGDARGHGGIGAAPRAGLKPGRAQPKTESTQPLKI